MKHFLSINQLSRAHVLTYIDRAKAFREMTDYPSYAGRTLVNLFYENSTRTRISFELAAKQLGLHVINVALDFSSEKKGEQIEDTLHTLEAMGIDIAVIRHGVNGMPSYLAQQTSCIKIINAGDGTQEHPTQALLDMMTIMDYYPDLSALKIVIIGDIKHSRVARSFALLSRLLGVGQLLLVAPEEWGMTDPVYGESVSDLSAALVDADVVMCLRVQKERFHHQEAYCLQSYQTEYQITKGRLKKASSSVLLMHPGPVNRGIELDEKIADDLDHSVILQQVKNGVFLRMSLLEQLILSV